MPGTRLGPYEVLSHLGAGGMGEVYRARDTKLNRDVALKVLPDSFATDVDRLARFRREAQVLAALNHPNVAAIYGFEESHDVRALVLELVEGPTLADRIAQGPMPPDEALPIAKQIVDALEAAHEQGIIHRDLKPANIKLRPDGTVKILDFGLAKAIEPVSGMSPGMTASPTITSPAMTQMGVILGTAAYMSPEQARGRAVDKRADIWAFGCVLYEMLTGRRAFEDEDVSMTLSKVLQREPDFERFPDDVPPHVRQTIRLCLRKPLKERVADIGAVRLALDGAFETAPPTPNVVHQVRPLWRRSVPFVATALIAGVVTGLPAWILWPSGGPRPVHRFKYDLPSGSRFRAQGSPVAISPDGRHFIYNTSLGLYLQPLDTLESRLIPGSEPDLAAPFLSPDGESIAFFQRGSLKRISIRGGTPRVIADTRTASNGKLEEMRGLPFLSASWEVNDTILISHYDGISRVSANGGTPELLIHAEPGEQFHGSRLLPGGDAVLFTVTRAVGETRWDEADIVVQSLSTGRRTTIVKGGSDARYVPTGHLVYAVADALFAAPFDAGGLRLRGPAVSVLEGVGRPGGSTPSGAAYYGISAEGTLVYARAGAVGFRGFLAGNQNTLVWVDRQGREEPLSAQPRAYLYPRISPDGTRLAIDSRDNDEDVWIWDVRRQSLTRLSSHPALDGLPIWTPDGQRVVWASARAAGPLNLYSQRADGTGTIERLTDSPNGHRPNSFTPDGTRLVFSLGVQGRQDLAMLSVEGKRDITPIVQGNPTAQNGEVSPDGRWLAYESDESGRFEVYVRPFPAVDQGRWPVSTAGGRQPAWSRNGRELFYIAADRRLMAATIEVPRGSEGLVVGPPVALHDGSSYYDSANTPNRGRTYDVSADGTRFLRVKPEASPTNAAREGLVVVVNWFEELKRRVPTK